MKTHECKTKSTESPLSIDEILTEILLKVPIKPLIRSKLVSKHWLSLISANRFWFGYNPTPNPASAFFMCIKNNLTFSYIYFPLYPNILNAFVPSINISVNTVILHSCNGLLLCCCSDDDSIYVYNPTTSLSCLIADLPTGSLLGATLAFDPKKSMNYKIVMVVYVDCREKRTYEIHVYSSETRSWSSGGEIPMCWWGVVFKNGVYWNGSVHWLSREPSVYQATISLRFHVDTRVVRKMVTPLVKSNCGRNYYFGESCGHLHFVEPVLPRFVVYEMKRDYSEWFVKYRVDLSAFVAEYRVIEMDPAYVLSFVRGENDEDSSLIMRIPGKAVKFNVVDGTSEKLCDFVHDKIQRSSVFGENRFADEYGFDYVQSLCSV